MQTIRTILISTLGLAVLAGCELRRDNRPSILLLAVEDLSFDSVSCDSEDVNQGFDVFCDEGIRFAHAFTPSTMSQSTLSSILTGMYPTRHGVHGNGSDHLSSRFRTVGKAATEKGYRTAMISGGPPIFRKSGLAQGFELFDDNMDLSMGHYYRPVSDVFSLFNDWLTKEVGSSPFFATLFLADLQFPEVPTFTDSGELREKTVESQLQEVGESLHGLVAQLKAKKRWDSTYVILIGLGGNLHPSNLKSENTQVTFYVKPARTARDSGSHWTIDRNVSLVDVGATLFAILGDPVDTVDSEVLEKTSLLSALSAPEPDWRDDRVIYTESGWTPWRHGSSLRVALRQKQFLFINDTKPLIFNSLTDHMENTPLSEKDALWASVSGDISNVIQKLEIQKWNGLPSPAYDLGSMIWAHRDLSEKMEGELGEVIDGSEKNPQIAGWWARWALEREQWQTLSKLGVAARQPLWTYVGQSRGQGQVPSVSDAVECASFFRGTPSTTGCNDDTLLAVNRWVQEKNDEERIQRRERAIRLYATDRIHHRIGQLNYLNYAKWDVRLDEPKAPSLTELYLALPRNHAIATQMETDLGSVWQSP